MTKEQIREQIKEIQKVSPSTRFYPQELRDQIESTLNQFKTKNEAWEYYGVPNNLLYRGTSKSISTRHVYHGATKRYDLTTKIQAAKMVLEEGQTIVNVSKSLGMTTTSISKWISDYQQGLYSLKYVTQISRKKFITSTVAIEKVEQAEKNLEQAKQIAKEAIDREYKENLRRIGE